MTQRLNERAKYIQKTVKESDLKVSDVVGKLSEELFISKRTVWRDLAKNEY